MIKNKRIFLIMVICILLIVLLFPYIKVEILTIQHKSEFNNLYESNGMLKEIEYFKVMNYSKKSAEVYYVSKGKKAGLLYEFIKDEKDVWQLEQWDVVWSASGSADNFIWPYYR